MLKFIGRLGPQRQIVQDASGRDVVELKMVQQFRGGAMVIKEPWAGENFVYSLTPSDIGKSFEFQDENLVLEMYPQAFAKSS